MLIQMREERQTSSGVSAEATSQTATDGETAIRKIEGDVVPPDHKIANGYKELQGNLKFDLLESLRDISPSGFERLVVALLERMDYGRGSVVGGSADGGIDGIINQDVLGLEKVFVQAKRWADPVPDREIRNFSGSLDTRGANKGVFITTSSFSGPAKQAAATISAGTKLIRLIDGVELAELMIENNVGVITERTYEIKRLEENYFTEEV